MWPGWSWIQYSKSVGRHCTIHLTPRILRQQITISSISWIATFVCLLHKCGRLVAGTHRQLFVQDTKKVFIEKSEGINITAMENSRTGLVTQGVYLINKNSIFFSVFKHVKNFNILITGEYIRKCRKLFHWHVLPIRETNLISINKIKCTFYLMILFDWRRRQNKCFLLALYIYHFVGFPSKFKSFW